MDNIGKNILAKFYGKKEEQFLYSGTLAIETSLYAAKICYGDYVLTANNVCYKIIIGILRTGAIPVLVRPINGLVLSINEIKTALDRYPIKALILVHHLGIPVDIKSIRMYYKDLIIIEDASQSWDLKYSFDGIGKYSDFVVASFGTNKPFSVGIGGGLFSNKDMSFLLDTNNCDSRNKNIIPLPYLLPLHFINEKFNDTLKNADIKVSKQRKFAKEISDMLVNTSISYWVPNKGELPSWHRFPIWTKEKKKFKYLINKAKQYYIKYQIPHSTDLEELRMFKEKVLPIDIESELNYFIYLLPVPNYNKLEIEKWINICD